MGNQIKRQTDEDKQGDGLDKVDDLMEKALEFGDQLAKASENAKSAIDKKQAADGQKSTKKKSSPSSTSESTTTDGGDDMDVNADTIADGLEKLKELQGDMKLSEASEWIREHPNMVETAIGDF